MLGLVKEIQTKTQLGVNYSTISLKYWEVYTKKYAVSWTYFYIT